MLQYKSKSLKLRLLAVILIALAAYASSPVASAAAMPTITSYLSVAPYSAGSPSWSQYVANSTFALENGLTTYGSGAAAFSLTGPTLTWADIVETSGANAFASWRGVAAPNSPLYSGEVGNSLAASADILSNGTALSISMVGYSSSSTNGNYLGYTALTPGHLNYSSQYIGIIYGAEGKGDFANYTYVTSGSSSQTVDEILVSSGPNLAIPVDTTTTGSTNQGKISGITSLLPIPTVETSEWYVGSLSGPSGSTAVTFVAAPEPSGGFMAIVGGFGLLGLMRPRRQHC